MTATNITVSTNGPRSQVKPGHPGPLAFFFPTDIFFHQLTKKKSFFFSLGRFSPASAVFRSCITGNSGHSGHVRFWQGKFSNRHFFSSTDKFFFQPTFCFSNRQKTVFFQMTNSGFFPKSAPSSRKSHFSVLARNFSKSTAKIPLNHRFRPVGVRPKKKLVPLKLWKTIPDAELLSC